MLRIIVRCCCPGLLADSRPSEVGEEEGERLSRALNCVRSELRWIESVRVIPDEPLPEEFVHYKAKLQQVLEGLAAEYRRNIIARRAANLVREVNNSSATTTAHHLLSERSVFDTAHPHHLRLHDLQTEGEPQRVEVVSTSYLQDRLAELPENERSLIRGDSEAQSNEEKKENPEDRSSSCCVCKDAQPTIAFRPCWHVCTCRGCCSELIANGIVKCPICRCVVKEFQPVYL